MFWNFYSHFSEKSEKIGAYLGGEGRVRSTGSGTDSVPVLLNLFCIRTRYVSVPRNFSLLRTRYVSVPIFSKVIRPRSVPVIVFPKIVRTRTVPTSAPGIGYSVLRPL